MQLTLAEAQEITNGEVNDDTLQSLLDDVGAFVDEQIGDPTGTTEYVYPKKTDRRAYIRQDIDTISSVKNKDGDTLDVTKVGKRAIEMEDGTAFDTTVLEITFVPIQKAAIRWRVERDLLILALQYSATESESENGEYSMSHVDYERERMRLLNSILGRRLA